MAEEVGAEHALGVKVDVTSRADVDAAYAAAVGRFGRLDLVVNNAGGCIVTSPPEDTSADDWHRQLDVTLVGAARCIQAAIPHRPMPFSSAPRSIQTDGTKASASASLKLPQRVPGPPVANQRRGRRDGLVEHHAHTNPPSAG